MKMNSFRLPPPPREELTRSSVTISCVSAGIFVLILHTGLHVTGRMTHFNASVTLCKDGPSNWDAGTGRYICEEGPIRCRDSPCFIPAGAREVSSLTIDGRCQPLDLVLLITEGQQLRTADHRRKRPNDVDRYATQDVAPVGRNEGDRCKQQSQLTDDAHFTRVDHGLEAGRFC